VTDLLLAPRSPVERPPTRRPRSVRRTSTMLMTWPGGLGADLHLTGRCRDLLTSQDGEAQELGSTDLRAVAGPDRTIKQISSRPEIPGLERLVGCRAGGNLRAAISQQLPDEVAAGTPLHLLLDDLAGSTLIAGFAFFPWRDRLPELSERRRNAPRREMENICSGFRSGASSLLPDGTQSALPQNTAPVPPLADPQDPVGWHQLDAHPAIAMRRARRIDVWSEDRLFIDAMFRDSCWTPDGDEVAVHEYHLTGTADLVSGALTNVVAEPRVLPYAECPAAASNAAWLLGTPLRDLRRQVLQTLRGTDCCTHLNDALRSLAEVPVLAASLPST
jgi:hypothetical protein